jgi:hypothetical protein
MKKSITITTLFFLLAACSNNSSNQKDNKNIKEDNASVPSSNVISFKVDGDPVTTEGGIVERFIWDDKTPGVWINITSRSNREKRTINVNLKGSIAGTYEFGNGDLMQTTHGSYYPDMLDAMHGYHFKTGGFVLTEVDTVKNLINGTFSGTARSSDGKTVDITDGQLINLDLQPGIINISAGFDQIKNEE